MKERRGLKVLATGGGGLFLLMAGLVHSRFTLGFDNAASETVKQFHQPAVNAIVTLLTNLNSPPALLILSLLLGGYLLYRHKHRELVIFLSGLWGTALLTTLVKRFVNRPRPLDRLVEIHSPSFPSWHSSTSMALALLLWVLLRPRYGKRARWIFLWPLAIGLSRIWLNAHWTSDVLAGWGLGAFVAASILLLLFRKPSS